MIRFDFHDDGVLFFDRPAATFVATTPDEVGPVLRQAEEVRRQGYWLAGLVSYEASAGIDPVFVTHPSAGFPLVWFGVYPGPKSLRDVTSGGGYHVGAWEPRVGLEEYARQIHRIREAIRAGLTYQVNYTMRWDASFSGEPYRWYHDLRRTHQGAYSAYLEVGRYVVLSASPELFFRITGSRIWTRPMKGTAPRGAFSSLDRDHHHRLRQSEKERAENIMIVDLMRNDLGRIARWGSVEVASAWRIERYPTVWQMTSTVSAELRPEMTWVDALHALFPAGSITGAPKARTMEIIQAVEPDPRGIYCGTIGYVKPNGDAVFNVAIRTVSVDRSKGRAQFGVGGGITWDSLVDGEYRELSAKAAFLEVASHSFALVETVRVVDGCITLKDYHTDRLRQSVEYFGWDWHSQAVVEAWSRLETTGAGRFRGRLLYHADGRVVTEITPLAAGPGGMQSVAYARNPMPPTDVWTWHKTTRRDRYVERHPAESRVFDHLLFNDRGEVTEFTRGNLVVKMSDGLWTPPIASGLLPGTFRQYLLDRKAVRERIITFHDVEKAEQLWFINSVRGWVPVRLVNRAPSLTDP